MAIQKNDRIYLDGRLYELLSTPLKDFFEAHPDIPFFRGRMPECRRGYVATWRIRNNVLYLTGFQQVSPTVVINPIDVLNGPKVIADWYDGILRIPISPDRCNPEGSCDSQESELHIYMQRGIVYNHQIIQNKSVAPCDSKNKPFKRSSK